MIINQPSLITRAMWYATVGGVTAVIASGAIAGHMFHIPVLTGFGGSVAMALNTAICFLLTGSAWITHALDLREDSIKDAQPTNTHGG